jgi:hypothetical protein
MPRTIENHLAGVTTNAPHPESYRPDLPLLLGPAALFREDIYDRGYDDGYDDGKERGREVGYAAGERDATAKLRRQSEKPSA